MPLAAAALAGCDDGGTLQTVRPSMTLAPEPGTTLDLGEVVLGRSLASPRILRVGNVGDGTLVLNRVVVEGDGAAAFRVSSYPRVVYPSGERELFVRFEPTAQADYTATLRIQSNDPLRPDVTYPLVAKARNPCAITLGPSYSVLKLGERKKLTLTSAGGVDCKITYLFTDSTLFPIVDAPETPFVLPAGQAMELTVQHSAPSTTPGVPIRQVLVRESEGSEVFVSLEGEPPISGCLELDSTTRRLLFGQTAVGETSMLSARVINRCNREAWVTAAIITLGVYYFDVDDELFPQVVPPNGSIEVPVRYLPFRPSGDDGILSISTNDVSSPRFSVELFGTAAVPVLTYFPTLLDFGTVVFKNPMGPALASECASNAQFVQLYNEGDAPLQVQRMEIDPAGDASFEVVGVLVGGQPVANFQQPFVIPRGSDAKVSLRFNPTRAMPSAHESALTIYHNVPDTAPARITLRGEGAGDGATTDAFTQLTGPKVDILWVIDSSGSMANEQALLVQNMSQFVGYADSVNADYQMAVTDTDGHSPSAGLFEFCYPYPRIIRSGWGTPAEREDAFRCMFTVGTDGPGNEAGLAAAYYALQRATSPNQDPVANKNAGFVRDDANLVIVVVSDEDDGSDESQELLRDYFLSIHGASRPDRVTFHAIAGPVAEECQTGPTQAFPGFNYYWMTQQLGGNFLNICNEDWQPLLQSLGIDTFQPLAEWTLSQAADPGSLTVRVDGVEIPRGTGGFTYNPSANSIRFDTAAVPSPGAEITVDYSGLCRP
ncbi:choice-of-anchor D domain-containing protein [Myxococcota bacterium]|nr:choice-of-anchor D domain-containing protein [Myxococcota bacterium]